MNEILRDRRNGARETAHYIASLAGQLAEMADAASLPVLHYLLEMAREEAASIMSDDHSRDTLPPE
ncbi:hypothetical protein MKI84_01090 [Ancylobacter sp. A5.8]|uniref:hypothetical protein n=1 Tax=Ancylobacter gelatini TaxID=2919920 RepID=UPI001F4D362D|nr:hypothetical protein [Ancylobacter gelatini]MCJ8141507.1 hypothetical protein [Ancylobacter gelatini]